VPDRGEDGDDALAASFGLFAADKIALIQMHVVPAHGEQLINTHAGVHQHQRDLSGEPQTVGRGGIVGDSLDALDLGAGEGALFFGRGRGQTQTLGVIDGNDIVLHGPLAQLAEQLPLLFTAAAGKTVFGQSGDDLLVVLGLELAHLSIIQRRSFGVGLLVAVLPFGADILKVDILPLCVNISKGIA